jgi:RNA polymerase sigma-70 factor (family 1)
MPEPKPEWEVIALFHGGNKWAFQHVYGLHNKTLCYFAAHLTRNQQQAEEIVSDAFVKLFRLRQNFDSLTNIRAFLYITVRNASFNAIRQTKRLTKAQQELLYLMQNEADHQEFDEIETSLLEKVYVEIELLPKQCRQVFKLIFVDRMTTTEIAEQMNLSRNTVQNHKARAMKLLRTAFLKKKLLSTIIMYGSFNKIIPYLTWLSGWLGLN